MIFTKTAIASALLSIAFASSSFAQNDSLHYELQEVTVTGSRVPLTDRKSPRQVMVLSRTQIQQSGARTINDVLKYAAGVDVRQRGGFGVQTDISVNGGTFDQVTILLNGVPVNSPQSGHLTSLFPVSMEDIERIEILEGPSARLFGTAAFTGAINIVTKTDSSRFFPVDSQGGSKADKAGKADRMYHFTVRQSEGSFGTFDGGINVGKTGPRLSQQLSYGFNRSDGGTDNSDFNVHRTFYQGAYVHPDVDVHWQAGFINQKYGANTFYSAAYPDQYEHTRAMDLSVRAETKGWLHVSPSIYWNRSRDNFQLVRNTSFAENFHRTDVFGVNVNAYFTTILGKTAFGAELRDEGIYSTNLGKPLDASQYLRIPGQDSLKYTKHDTRTNIDYYVEHNIMLSRMTISLGLLVNYNSSLSDGFRYYPGIDVSYRPDEDWKLYASWNKALRMPTFTDLYYKSPTQEGNIGLKPEQTTSYKVGATYQHKVVQASLNGFWYKGTDMIDWVKYSADDTFHSANFSLDNKGVEGSVRFIFGEDSWIQRINLGYTYIDQDRHDDQQIYKSNYAMEYLRHKFVAGLTHRIWGKSLTATWNFREQKRMGGYEIYGSDHKPTGVIQEYPAFGIMDLRVQWQSKRTQVYVQAYNLFDKQYYDFGNVPQPGRWLMFGIVQKFNL